MEAELKLLLFGGVVLATSATALVLLAASPRRNWNQWLAFFLLLVAGNYAAQVGSALLSLSGAPPGSDRFLNALGFLFLIFDPAVLAYFASIFPRRTALAESRSGIVLLGACVVAFTALEVWGHHLSTLPGNAPWRVLFFVYLGGCYLYATWRLLRNYVEETSRVMAEQVRVVALGIMIAALPRVALLPEDLLQDAQPILGIDGNDPAVSAALLALRLGLLVGLLLVARRWLASAAPGMQAGGSKRLLRQAAAVFAVFAVLWSVHRLTVVVGGTLDGALAYVRSLSEFSAYAIRWVAFAVAISIGLARDQVLVADPRRALRVGAAAALAISFVSVGVAASALGPWTGAGLAVLIPVAAALAYLTLGARRHGDDALLHHRSLDAYGALLASRMADGGLAADDDDALREARRRLGISQQEHTALVAIARTEDAEANRPEVVVGRYVLLRRLGAGAFATVHLARDSTDGNLVALKRIHALGPGTRAALDTGLRELEVARRVTHPNLVSIHDVLRVPDGALLVMEFADQGSLRDTLEARGALDAREAARILRGILEGLDALHRAGIVHGDLKPENVLLADGGRVLLSDFGAASTLDPRQTLVGGRAQAATASLLYMAPEQARGQPSSPASDLYAAGAIAVEMLTGQPLADAGDGGPSQLLRVIAAGPPLPAGMPGPWATALAPLLAPDPSARPASAEAVITRLAAAGVLGGATSRLQTSWKERTGG